MRLVELGLQNALVLLGSDREVLYVVYLVLFECNYETYVTLRGNRTVIDFIAGRLETPR